MQDTPLSATPIDEPKIQSDADNAMRKTMNAANQHYQEAQTPSPDNITTNNAIADTSTSDKLASLTSSPTAEHWDTEIKLTGRLLNFTRLNITGNQVDKVLEKLKTKLGQQRHSKLPVVVSCRDTLDLNSLWTGLWALGLQPIGVVTGVLDEQAQQQQIAIFPADGQRIDGKTTKSSKSAVSPLSKVINNDQAIRTAVAAPSTASSNNDDNNSIQSDKFNVDNINVSSNHASQLEGDLVHSQILRSGQSINHVGGDLILTHGINAGAEAITDYSLHVYGKAEGRLVAGATGDKNAKIFCLKFNPSLVSVAGTYCLKENIPEEFINQSVQVSYVEGAGLVFNLIA